MNTTQQALIQMDAVQKIFLTDEMETHALEDVNLKVSEGEFVAIVGPSGCGKSTLLAILGLLDTATKGSYSLNGHPTEGLSVLERARLRNEAIGFVFQGFNLIGDLSVFENVELPLIYRNSPRHHRKRMAVDALERVGMDSRLSHYPSQLSGGQQQRVAVARALVGQPLILLADEPTGNLDSKSGEQVMSLLSELHQGGSTICMVTHDPRYLSHAERTIHLFDGYVVNNGEKDGLTADALTA